jgi:YHS domain-containing protein
MFITTILASLTLGVQAPAPLVCPATGESIAAMNGGSVDYNGVRYTVCCGGCADPFKKDPVKMLSSEKLKGKTMGVFLFDPISGKRIDAKKAQGGSSDFGGIRYYFASADEKKAFDAEPKKYAGLTKKEALFCPVMGHAVESAAKAGAYADVDGVRYYTCCADCLAALKADPKKVVGSAASSVKAPSAVNVPKG